jgi:hypothetical protein
MKVVGGILIGIATGVVTLFAYDYLKGDKTDKPCSGCGGDGTTTTTGTGTDNGSGTNGTTESKPGNNTGGLTIPINNRPVTISGVTVSRQPRNPIVNNGTSYIDNGVNTRFQWR